MRARSMLMINPGIFFLLLFLGVAPAAPAAGGSGDVESLGDGAYLFRHGQHRSLFLVGERGVVATDPVSDAVARDYLAAIRGLTDLPVRYVVYSHYHWDRASGARIFKEAGAAIVAQQRCADRFEMNPNPAVVTPDVTFDQSMSINVGRRSLDLHYLGPSHGDCLTLFVAQPANVLQVVDLVNPDEATFPLEGMVPSIRPHNLRQFWTALSQLVIDTGISRVAAYQANELVIDGAPGVAPKEGGIAVIDAQSEFWSLIYQTVETARAERRVGIDSMVRLRKEEIAAFEGYRGFDSDSLALILRRFIGYYDMGR